MSNEPDLEHPIDTDFWLEEVDKKIIREPPSNSTIFKFRRFDTLAQNYYYFTEVPKS